MIEPEMAFADLEAIINLAKRLVKYVINHILANNIKELELLENYNQKEIISKLKKILGNDFRKVDYSESIEILKKNKQKFVFSDIK
jgi:asparaginyl-tRNA synthetase